MVDLDNKEVILWVACATCSQHGGITVLYGDLKRYEKGARLEEAFPRLTQVNQREVVIGWRSEMFTCPECWDRLRADEEQADYLLSVHLEEQRG